MKLNKISPLFQCNPCQNIKTVVQGITEYSKVRSLEIQYQITLLFEKSKNTFNLVMVARLPLFLRESPCIGLQLSNNNDAEDPEFVGLEFLSPHPCS
jgi:hypothetical protein